MPNFKQYPKLSKAVSGYLETEMFKNADMPKGYFCDSCTYFTKHHHCATVIDNGPGVKARESGIIAPHGCCMAYEENYDKLHDTRARRTSSGRYKE